MKHIAMGDDKTGLCGVRTSPAIKEEGVREGSDVCPACYGSMVRRYEGTIDQQNMEMNKVLGLVNTFGGDLVGYTNGLMKGTGEKNDPLEYVVASFGEVIDRIQAVVSPRDGNEKEEQDD